MSFDIDSAQLVSTSNLVRATLAREPELDEDAAIVELIESGKKLHLALNDVVKDIDFWARLETESLRSVVVTTEQADKFAVFAAAQHIAVLEVLGYRPPPPAQELVDETVEALQVLRELSYEPSARLEHIVQARTALRVFNARLGQLLVGRGVMPPVVRRSLLRRTLHQGAKVALVLAPLGLAYGAKFAAEAFGIPGDAIKDVAQQLAGAAATMIATMLPEAKTAEVEAATILGEIDGKARVRALASLVQARLLTLNVEDGLNQVAYEAMLAALIQMDSAARRYLRPTNEYLSRRKAFVESLTPLEEQASEQNLRRVVRAWADVQATLDQMESQPSQFDSRMQELALGQERRAAAERARLEEQERQRVAGEQVTLEEQERRRVAAARADEERRRQQAAAEEAQRQQAQRSMTMEQGG